MYNFKHYTTKFVKKTACRTLRSFVLNYPEKFQCSPQVRQSPLHPSS